ncbi:Leucine Rich Repeat domain protein [Pelomyxa schiedti]|nr:Leucine Rich Repeat domain protein [Pelomyxa schiedti]
MVNAASVSSLSEIWLPHTNLSNLSFCQLSFKKAILSSSDLSGSTFNTCDLSGCNLSGCTFSQTCLTDCKLCKSDVTHCAFIDASMNNCTFIGADLSNTSLVNSCIKTSSFEACHMTHSTFDKAKFPGTSFADCDMSGLDLKDVDFSGSKFRDVDLTRMDLSGCVLSGCSFDKVCFLGSVAAGVNFSSSKFHAADFTQADINRAHMCTCLFDETCFLESIITGVDFTSSKFLGTVLTKIKGNNVSQVSFNSVQADLTTLLNWTGLIMGHTSFTACKLRGTIFSVMHTSCVFDRADFTGADFTSCLFPDDQTAGITWIGVTMAAIKGFETVACKSSEFRDSQFSDIEFKDRYWTFQNCSFTNVQLKDVCCSLQNCSFTGCNIEALLVERVPTTLSFSSCIIKNVDLSSLPAQATLLLKSCTILGAKFQSNHIKNLFINDCTVEDSDLNECSALNIDRSKFFKCEFLRSTFVSTLDCSFCSCCLRGLLLEAPDRALPYLDYLRREPVPTLVFDNSDISFSMAKRFHITKLSHCSTFNSFFDQCDLDNLGLECDNIPTFRKCSFESFNFSHANLSHHTFLECDLSGKDMTGANLSGTKLKQTNLQSVVMIGTVVSKKTELSQCNIRRAVIQGNDLFMRMSECPLVGAILEDTTWGPGANLAQKNFSGITLYKVDFSSANMFQVDLSYSCASPYCVGRESASKELVCPAIFSGANLTEAKLVGVDFHHVNFSGAILTSAIFVEGSQQRPTVLEGANLQQACLESVDLHGSNLAGVQFDKGSILKNANLEGCSLTGALLSDVDLSTTRLNGAILEKTQWTGKLHDLSLYSHQLKGATFNSACLERVNFHHCWLEGVKFDNCTFSGVSLEYAHLDGAEIRSGNDHSPKQTDLTTTKLSYATLKGASLRVNMQGVELRSTIFEAGFLLDCDFSRARLIDVHFTNCTLTNVCFAGASLEGVDFRSATLKNCNLNVTCATKTDFDHVTCTGTLCAESDYYQIRSRCSTLTGITIICRRCGGMYSDKDCRCRYCQP